MDITEIVLETQTVEIRNPNTEKLMGLRFELRSPEDPKVKAVTRAFQNEQLKRNKKPTVEKFEEFTRDQIVAAFVSGEWYSPTGEEADMGSIKGERPAIDEKWLRQLLRREEPFAIVIRRQLSEKLDDGESFFKNSGKS